MSVRRKADVELAYAETLLEATHASARMGRAYSIIITCIL